MRFFIKQLPVGRLLALGGILFLVASGAAGQGFHESHHSSSPKINYDSLLAAAVPITTSDTGQEIVSACLARYGGETKLKTLRDFELTYEVTSKFGDDSYRMVKTFQQGRRYRIRMLDEDRILNGTECWFENKTQVKPLDGGRYRAEFYSYLTLAMPLAIRTEPFEEIRYGERDNDPLAYVYMEKSDSLVIVLGIDRNEHFIQTVEGVIRQDDRNFIFVNKLADYQEHDGFLFPGTVTTVSLGLEVGRAELKAVRVNPGLTDKDFKPSTPEKMGEIR